MAFTNVSKATAVVLPEYTTGYVDLDVTNQPDDPRGGPQTAWFRVPYTGGSSIFPIAFNQFHLIKTMFLGTYGDPGTGYDAVGNRSDNQLEEAIQVTLATTRHEDGAVERDAPFGADAPVIDAPHFSQAETWWQAAWAWPGTVIEAMYLLVTPTASFLAQGGVTRIYFDTTGGRYQQIEVASYLWYQALTGWYDHDNPPAWTLSAQEWPIEPGETSAAYNWYRQGIRGPGAVRSFTPNYTGVFEMRTENFYAAVYRVYDREKLRAYLLHESSEDPELPLTQSGPFSDGTHLISCNVVKGRAYLLHLTASSDARQVQHLLDGAPPTVPPWIDDEAKALGLRITHTEISAASGSLARPYELTATGIVRRN